MATPEQQFTASNVRGYSKEFLAQACSCEHRRIDHAKRAGACVLCPCAVFSVSPLGKRAVTPNPREVFVLGTIGRPSGPVSDHQLAINRCQPAAGASPQRRPDQTSPAEWVRARGVEAFSVRADDFSAQAVQSPPAVLPRDAATRCPFCHADDFETVPSVRCAACKAWQHHACVLDHRKCAACNTQWPSR